MVIASHVIFSVYGFWLPNDPRGSWSDFVGAWEQFRFGGPATKVNTHRSVAASPHDRNARMAAKTHLKYPPVKFDGVQALAVGNALGELAQKSKLNVWACSILPQHIHLVLGRHDYEVEQIVTLLKGEATRLLVRRGIHPMAKFPRRNGRFAKCWARGEWKVFLDCTADVRRAINYVEQNPLKERLKRQRWSFVRTYGR